MPLEYELLDDHTLVGKESSNTSDLTVKFEFISPREILAHSKLKSQFSPVAQERVHEMSLFLGTEPKVIFEMQEILAQKGGKPIGGFLKDIKYPK